MENGNKERGPNTTHVVSMWYIPGGMDYSNAKVVKYYFDSADEAEAFAKPNMMPPEMAVVIPISDWDLIEKTTANFNKEEIHESRGVCLSGSSRAHVR